MSRKYDTPWINEESKIALVKKKSFGRNTGTIKIHKTKQNMKKQELKLTG